MQVQKTNTRSCQESAGLLVAAVRRPGDCTILEKGLERAAPSLKKDPKEKIVRLTKEV